MYVYIIMYVCGYVLSLIHRYMHYGVYVKVSDAACDDDDSPLILHQKSSMNSMLMAHGMGDIKISK